MSQKNFYEIYCYCFHYINKSNINNLLEDARNQFHRVPMVVQPVLVSIEDEINDRLESLMEEE